MHSRTEYDRNTQEMLALYQKLSWKDQVLLIGRLSVMVEKEREKRVVESTVTSPAPLDHIIIQFLSAREKYASGRPAPTAQSRYATDVMSTMITISEE